MNDAVMQCAHLGTFTQIEIMWQGISSVITKDQNGLFNLTEVFKASKLAKSKGPSKWAEGKEVKAFIERQIKRSPNSGNAYKVIQGGKVQGTWGNERILQKYLQWLSPEYEDVVLDAIQAVATGEVRTALSSKDSDHLTAGLEAIIATRKSVLQNIEAIKKIEEKVEEVLKGPAKRSLIVESPPMGYQNKQDVIADVASLTKTTKAIVEAVLYFYSSSIAKKEYLVERIEDVNIVSTYPVCYSTSDVITYVKHAVYNSYAKTPCYRIFRTLGNKRMKLKGVA